MGLHSWDGEQFRMRSDAMAEETAGGDWAAASQAVGEEVRTWQRAHPVATLTEIEVAVEAATAKLQARLVADLAQEVGEAVTAAADRPVCPACGERLVRRGKRSRSVVVAHQAQHDRATRVGASGAGVFRVPGLWGRVPASGCFPPSMRPWVSCRGN